jgi:transcriptional regulator with XRE-family HTH domain
MVKSPNTESGKVLLRALEEKGLSQKTLADELNVSQAYVSALTSGRKTMSPGTADKIATALALSPTETTSLHRAAARDQGFRLDLPDGF